MISHEGVSVGTDLRQAAGGFALGVPGGIELDGVAIDLSKVKVPACFISTVEDHIAPWKTTYQGAKHLGGMVRFVLGGSGHVAGIVNPPAEKRYCYWTNAAMPATLTEWFEGAEQHVGSWWDDWQAWMERQNPGEQVLARYTGARSQGDRGRAR
jgi:polyhydroxyalkanoate synthase